MKHVAILFWLFVVVSQAQPPDIKIIKNDLNGFEFDITFDSLKTSLFKVSQEAYEQIAVRNLINEGEAGTPSLPTFQCLVAIPQDRFQVRIIPQSEETGILRAKPAPVPFKRFHPGTKIDEDLFEPNSTVYQTSTFPTDGHLRISPDTIGNQRVLRLTLFPVVVSPADLKYNYCGKLKVQVSFNGASGTRRPSSSFESFLQNNILNYEIARSFRLAPPVKKRLVSAAASPLDEDDMIKITIRGSTPFSVEPEGLYRITAKEVASTGASLSGIDIREVRLYSPAYGNVLDQSYRNGDEDKSSLQEIPILVNDRNGNSIFDSDDDIVFYAAALAGFYPTNTDFVFRVHPYDVANYYWLALKNTGTLSSALRLDTLSIIETVNRKSVNSYSNRIHREEDVFNPTAGTDYFKVFWLWRELPYGGYSFSENLDAYVTDVASPECRIQPEIDRYSSGDLHSLGNKDLKINDVNCVWSGSFGGNYLCSNLKLSGENILAVGHNNDSVRCALNWYELTYLRKLSVRNASLVVYGYPGRDTLFDYTCTSEDKSGLFCWDVSNPLFPRAVRTTIKGDSIVFSSYGFVLNKDSLIGRKFCLSTLSSFKKVTALEMISRPNLSSCIRDLKNTAHSFDYLIIAPQIFHEAANRLAIHRTTFQADGVQNAKVVLVEDIYDYFSAGKTDISAIRNCIIFAKEHWGVTHTLLIGSGHREYRGSPIANYIPPFEVFVSRENNLIQSPYIASYGASDDFYSCTPRYGSIPYDFKMCLGRLPVSNQNEANWAVNKIIRFDTDNSSLKLWKNRALLVADDDAQYSGPDKVNASLNHMQVTETLANNYLPTSMDVVKVYLQKYPVVSTSREKPEAEFDLVESINLGTLFWVYVGHGGYEQLSDEKVFTLTKTFGRLKNYDKTGLFWAASCSVGEFDIANQGSICTRLILSENSGMTATIGGSQLTDGQSNAQLLYAFTRALFHNASKPAVSLGEALADAKSNYNYPNSRYYNLFGDPAQFVYPRQGNIVIDSESAICDTFRMLQKIKLTGYIADSTASSISGKIGIRLTAPSIAEDVSFSTGETILQQRIINIGGTLVSQVADVQSGRFSFDFMIPKSIPFFTHTSTLNYFAWYGEHIAEKQYSGISFSGETPDSGTVFGDGQGPQISAYGIAATTTGTDFESSPVGESIAINKNSIIRVTLDDADGIRTDGKYVNEGVLYEIVGLFDRRRVEAVNGVDGMPNRKYFTLTLSEELFGITQDLTGKSYELMILAQDNYDNRSKKSYKITFGTTENLSVTRNEIFNYPNPFSESTRFLWTSTETANVTIKIYSQSGRLIRVLKSKNINGSYAPGANCVWDGRDEEGHKAARGIYYFSLQFKPSKDSSPNAQAEKSFVGKMMRN